MTTPRNTPEPAPAAADRPMAATYVRVIAVQLFVLAVLWGVQQYFNR